MDIFVRVFRLQEQELGDHQVGISVVDRCANEKDSVLQEAGEDVVSPLTPTGLLDHHWNEEHARTPSAVTRGSRDCPPPPHLPVGTGNREPSAPAAAGAFPRGVPPVASSR